MNLIIQKSSLLEGEVVVPSSKSQSVRGLVLALLSSGRSIIKNGLDADDTQEAIRVCQQLGARITIDNNTFILESNGLPITEKTDTIYTGNSGITTRFIMPILGLRKNPDRPIILNCGEQMRARPIQSLVNALRNLGLTIQYIEKETVLPIAISGELKGGVAEVEGITSQYLSALLLSLPCAKQDSEITVKNLHERPYMEMTLDWLRQQNIYFTHEIFGDKDVYFIRGNQTYKPFTISITGDFSSASYFIAAATLIPGSVKIKRLNIQDLQGDKRLISILQKMGADIQIDEHDLWIQGGKILTGIKIDANDIPDLLPTLAVIGTQAMGQTEIDNVGQARIKETDRIHSMTEGLTRLGARIDERKEGMIIYQSKLHGNAVKGYGDHRTVMALSLAGMLAEGSTMIDDGEAINKTFPMFIKMMQSLGAKIEEKTV